LLRASGQASAGQHRSTSARTGRRHRGKTWDHNPGRRLRTIFGRHMRTSVSDRGLPQTAAPTRHQTATGRSAARVCPRPTPADGMKSRGHDPLRLGPRPPGGCLDYGVLSHSQHGVSAPSGGSRRPRRPTRCYGPPRPRHPIWVVASRVSTDTRTAWAITAPDLPPTGCTSATLVGSTIALKHGRRWLPGIASDSYNDTIT